MDVKLVVFDIGGVMIRICHTWAEAVSLAGVKTTNPEPGRLSQCWFLDEYQKSALTVEQYLVELAVHLGCDTPQEALKVHNQILVEEYPGIKELVADLQSLGIKTACLSNTADLHWQEMVHSGRFPAYSALDHHFASHIEGLNKPDPEIYHRVEAGTNTSPENIIFFDDYQRNVDGARAVSWTAETIDAGGDSAGQVRAFLASIGLKNILSG
jgi:putative hydrolase of the HAD superfamily